MKKISILEFTPATDSACGNCWTEPKLIISYLGNTMKVSVDSLGNFSVKGQDYWLNTKTLKAYKA